MQHFSSRFVAESFSIPGAPAEHLTPLVVDVDGTLVKTDLLVESALKFAAVSPFAVWKLPCWLRGGKAHLKARLAGCAAPDIELVPLNEPVVAYIRRAQAEGRPVHLASAADRSLIEGLAKRLQVESEVLASDGTVNLSGRHKADALVERFGEGGFDYIGNDPVDIAVWQRARKVICASHSEFFARKVARLFDGSERIRPEGDSVMTYLKALRPHQWSKNALLALPMLVTHAVTLDNLAKVALAFIAFSLLASSVYLINDMCDLDSDRQHPSKRRRPFASGKAMLMRGLPLVPVLTISGFAVGASVSLAFLATMLGYFALTLAYSFNLKRRPITDVVALGGLYMVRVFAGGVAIEDALSPFMLGFCVFFFLCLALVKRWAELLQGLKDGRVEAAGRGYRTSDIPFIAALAVAAGYSAVVVLALYVTSESFTQFYERPEAMWFSCIIVLYWVSRILFRTHRGRMHDDPVVWALNDYATYVLIALIIALGIFSAY